MDYMKDCLFCRISKGFTKSEVKPILMTKKWIVEPSTESLTEGTTILRPFLHRETIAELTFSESKELGLLLKGVAQMIKHITKPDQIYISLWSHYDWQPQHIHIYLQPVYNSQKVESSQPGPFLQSFLMSKSLKPNIDELNSFSKKMLDTFAERGHEYFPSTLLKNIQPIL